MLPPTGGSGADIATLRSQWKGKAPTRPDIEGLWEGELPVGVLASHLTTHKPLWRTDFPPEWAAERVQHKTLRGVPPAGTQQGVRTWGRSTQRPPRHGPANVRTLVGAQLSLTSLKCRPEGRPWVPKGESGLGGKAGGQQPCSPPRPPPQSRLHLKPLGAAELHGVTSGTVACASHTETCECPRHRPQKGACCTGSYCPPQTLSSHEAPRWTTAPARCPPGPGSRPAAASPAAQGASKDAVWAAHRGAAGAPLTYPGRNQRRPPRARLPLLLVPRASPTRFPADSHFPHSGMGLWPREYIPTRPAPGHSAAANSWIHRCRKASGLPARGLGSLSARLSGPSGHCRRLPPPPAHSLVGRGPASGCTGCHLGQSLHT